MVSFLQKKPSRLSYDDGVAELRKFIEDVLMDLAKVLFRNSSADISSVDGLMDELLAELRAYFLDVLERCLTQLSQQVDMLEPVKLRRPSLGLNAFHSANLYVLILMVRLWIPGKEGPKPNF